MYIRGAETIRVCMAVLVLCALAGVASGYVLWGLPRKSCQFAMISTAVITMAASASHTDKVTSSRPLMPPKMSLDAINKPRTLRRAAT